MTMRRLSRKVVGLVVLVALFAIASACASEPQSVSIAKSQWNYDIITTGVLERAFEAKGYDVTTQDVSALGPTYAAISQNDINMYPGFWLPTLQSSYVQQYGDKLAIERDAEGNPLSGVGNVYGAPTPIRWTVPNFVVEEHDIHTYADLKGKGDLFNNKIIGYEEGTGGTIKSREAIEAYGLAGEYEFVPGSVPSMMAELRTNVEQRNPVIVVGWRPNPVYAKQPVTMLEDPKDIFGTDTVSHAVNKEFADAHPEIIAFLENFVIPLAEMEEMMVENEDNDVPADELADQWYNDNKATIEGWWE